MTETAPPGARADGTLPEFPLARECPYQPPSGYTTLRASGPITRVSVLGEQEAWLVTGYAEARALLADPRISSNRAHPNFPLPLPGFAKQRKESGSILGRDADEMLRTLIGADPPEHNRQRRMLIPSFTVKRINTLRPGIQRIVDARLAAMLDNGPPADLVADFALPVPSMVICELLGVPYADHEFFEEQSRRRLEPSTMLDAVDRLWRYLDELIQRKETDRGDGLLDELITDRLAAGELDRGELIMFALILLIAGHDTTANMIALGTVTLLAHPDRLASLRSNPDLLVGTIEEQLRYLSIVSALPRVAAEDIEIGGQLIRGGDGVLVALVAANRDAALVERPDEFEVERSGRAHIAFGYGIHQCLGQNLARAELEIAFRALLDRVPTLRLAVVADELHSRPGLLSGLTELPVTW